MSKPAKLKFTIYQGATFRKRLIWRDSAGVAINLTGCTARMHIRAKQADATPLLTLTTENSRITLGGIAGTTDLFISDDDTTAITWTAGVWDLEIEHPAGDVTRLAEGSIAVSKEVTRA
jgi:hypothetical protein